MTKRFATPLATLATVAVLTLTGCSAGSLTGPELPDTDAATIQTAIPGNQNVARGAVHNEPGAHNDAVSTRIKGEHNELPED